MTARLLDGLGAAAAIKDDLRKRVARLTSDGATPGLATVLVGDDPASASYVGAKHRDCAEIGVMSIPVTLPAAVSTGDVLAAVEALNSDPRVTGFIVQLPLPAQIDDQKILETIDPAKDADGLHPMNLGRLVLDIDGAGSAPVPCTPAGILALLDHHHLDVAGAEVVIVGRGLTVGRPLSLLLTRKGVDATVTIAHSRTVDLAATIRRADVVVAAVGVPHLVRAEWIRPGAIVLDVGVTRVGYAASGRAQLHGDVHPDVAGVAGWLSPQPGGVGPMTRAMLLANVVRAAEKSVDERGRRSEST